MRLWHYKIIPHLPKSQLIAQWRELNSIFAKQDNHILINYIYDYEKGILKHYTRLIINEMYARGYKIRTWEKYDNYFLNIKEIESNYCEHDERYFQQCFFNLQEKYDREQKDYTETLYKALESLATNTNHNTP